LSIVGLQLGQHRLFEGEYAFRRLKVLLGHTQATPRLTYADTLLGDALLAWGERGGHG
jgi:hypothetical protein